MENIIIEAEEVWEYYKDNEKDLNSSMHLIASNDEYGIEIYITKETECACVEVLADDINIYKHKIHSCLECNYIIGEVYDEYLTSKAVSTVLNDLYDNTDFYGDSSSVSSDGESQQQQIYQREEELDDAIYNLLAVFLEYADTAEDEETDILTDMVEGLKENICAYLYDNYDVNIYRPMVIEFDDGTEDFFEYPYEYLAEY